MRSNFKKLLIISSFDVLKKFRIRFLISVTKNKSINF